MTKRILQNSLRSRRLLLAGLTLLGSLTVGSVVRSNGGVAFAQVSADSIPLRNIVQYYSNFPHQNRAIAILQQQIDKNQPEILQEDSIFSNVWRASATLAGHEDILPGIAQSDRIGSDPLEMALAIVNLTAGEPVDIEVLRDESAESSNAVVVTIDQNSVLDDSVAGIRRRFDIAKQEDSQWEIRRAGRQVRCRAGRGHQDWSAELCL